MKIGNLTSDYRDGIEILEIIKKKKIFKYIEENDFFIGLESRVYIYSSIEDKEEHQNQMVKEGWETEDGQEYIQAYKDNKDEDKNIKVPCAFYVKYIPGIYGVLYKKEDELNEIDSIDSILKMSEISNLLDIEVFKSFFEITKNEEESIKKAVAYRKYTSTTENNYPELIMRFLRYQKGINEFDFSQDNIINETTEDEVYELLRDYQNKFNNLSKSVSDWVRSKYDKELN